MREAIDLSQEIYQGMPVFPGHLKTVIWNHVTHEETVKTLEKGYSYQSRGLLLCDHGPTHVDAINHIDPRPDAPSIDKMALDNFFGPALCLDVSGIPEGSLMGPEVIKSAEKESGQAIQSGDIVLFYTGHYDRHYPTPDYLEGYSGFSGEAAEYLIIEKKIKNWGVDSPSPDRHGDNSFPVHLVYRRTWIPHMENLCNLNKLVGRRFMFYGFPLKIRNGSGSPIRAVAVVD